MKPIYWWVGAGVALLLLVGNAGFRQLVSAWQDKHRTQKMLTALRAEHDRLAAELDLIQNDPGYTEYLVRKHLGYVKKGEVEYRLMKPGSEQKQTP